MTRERVEVCTGDSVLMRCTCLHTKFIIKAKYRVSQWYCDFWSLPMPVCGSACTKRDRLE